ncbi:hypothetical protein NFI96_024759, partial [Prochilodus magdalenae]
RTLVAEVYTRGCSSSSSSMATLTYEGCNFFRQRLVLSTLSGKRVKIRNIRSRDDEPGLRDFEASFIRLLDKVTNGTTIEINQTGTVLSYQPGLLYGGSVEHECNVQRSIGYYLEALIMLAPFTKNPLKAVLKGVTNDPTDPSVDLLKTTAVPLMKKFGINGEGLEIKVVKRGIAPGGGGEVHFTCPVCRTLKPVLLTEPGKIKRIRGMAYSVRVSPQMANRIVDSARSILNKFIPDIYIYTDHMKGASSGKSPGFGLMLVAETVNGTFLSAELASTPQGKGDPCSSDGNSRQELPKLLLEQNLFRLKITWSPGFGLMLVAETVNGTFLSAELASTPQGKGDPVLPEELGKNCAKLLLEEIYRVSPALLLLLRLPVVLTLTGRPMEGIAAHRLSIVGTVGSVSSADNTATRQVATTARGRLGFESRAECYTNKSPWARLLTLLWPTCNTINLGGCVDSVNQSLALLYMTLGQQDVSKTLLGPLSPYTIEFLRHIRDFFQIMFKIETQKADEDEQKGGEKVLLTCIGAGYINISKTLK